MRRSLMEGLASAVVWAILGASMQSESVLPVPCFAAFQSCRFWFTIPTLCILVGGFSYAAEGPVPTQSADLEVAKPSEMRVEVKAKKRASRASVSSVELGKKEIAELPQGSETTLSKLITSTTPGVVSGSFGQMFFRGNHSNIQYQLDGIQLPDSPSSTFGQSFSPRNIDRMEVMTGGFQAEYGQRLSAVVSVTTLSGPEEPGGEVQLNYGSYNTISPHVLYGGSDPSGRFHYFFSVNYNRTDRGLDTPQPASLDSVDQQAQGGTESIHNTASGNGEFAKLDWLLSEADKLHLILYHSQSVFQIPTFPSNFTAQSAFFQKGYADHFGNQNLDSPTFNYVPTGTDNSQSETNAYAQLVWKHAFDASTHFQFAPYYRYSLIVVKNDPTNDLASSGLIAGAEPSSFAQNRHVNNLGTKGEFAFRPSASHWIKTGMQVQASRSDGWFSLQTDPAIPAVSAQDPSIGYFEGVFVQDEYTLAPPLILNAGLRFDAVQFSYGRNKSSSDQLLQPRVGLTFLASESTKLHVYYGKLFQPAPVEYLRYQYAPGALKIEDFDLKAEKDDFYETGISHQFLPAQTAFVNVYYKNGVSIMDDHQLLNTSIAQPYSFDQGYAYGAEFSVRGQLNDDWSEYINYSYGTAQAVDSTGGMGIATGNTNYQILDHVQTHTANAGITYTKNSYWWTAQGLYGSGLRTGKANSVNLPEWFTVNMTVGYQFKPSSFFAGLKVSADVLNLFNNVYPVTIANGFNGSHYAAGRQYFVRLTQSF